MSMPSFPNTDNMPTRDQVINQIISSIAMEELGLSHIINAEGEKIQYALGTIEGVTGPDTPLTMDELLDLNNSVHKTLDSMMMNQFLLKEKLMTAISASVLQGPTGATGPQGPASIEVDTLVTRLEPEESPRVENTGSTEEVVLKFSIPRGATGAAGATILGSYGNYLELITAHGTGTAGDAYLVGGSLYVWDEASATWKDMGSIVGPTGATGAAGATILDSYDDIQRFIVEHPTGDVGDAYLVEGNLYVWGGTPATWQNMGSLVGPTGATGAAGATILASYDNYASFINEHPIGTEGDAYLVGGVLYVWGGDPAGWQDMGSLVGPAGQGIEILGSYATLDDLKADHATGEQGQVYAVDGVLYYWDEQANDWLPIENLNGPTGPAGPGLEILGTYDTLDDLVAAHFPGVVGELYVVGDLLYYWNPDENQWMPLEHINGPTGPTGATGPAGAGIEILGSYATIDELQTAHPVGEQGQVYSVNGVLYYWDDAGAAWMAIENLNGPTGPTGPTGPEASSYTIIPFATQMSPRTYAVNGSATRTTLLGFSYFYTGDPTLFIPDQSVILEANGSFVFNSSNRNKHMVFSVPFNARLRSIYATVGNALSFSPTGTVYPYIQIYQAAADSNVFFPILAARAEPVLGLGPNTVPEATSRPAFVDGLDIELPAGTRVGIGGMMRVEGDPSSVDYYLWFTGSICLSRSV